MTERDSGISFTPYEVLKEREQDRRLSALEAEVGRLRTALQAIAAYGDDGVCPYGCDTPHIARAALAGEDREP